MRIQFYQKIHCGTKNYIIRKRLQWDKALPRMGEQVTSASFLCDENKAYTVIKVTHDILESICYIELEDYSISEDCLLANEFERFAKLGGWECEKI